MSPDPHSSKIDAALLALAAADPSAAVLAIVRTVGRAGPRRAAAESAGLTVRHVYRLWPGLAVEGPVAALLALAAQPWVQAIEVDREVKVMGRRQGIRDE
jgi:hypothetical protein